MSSETAVTAAETPAANGHGEVHSTAGFKALMLGSIGVVYGDIGTSPLYALREAIVAASGHAGTRNRASSNSRWPIWWRCWRSARRSASPAPRCF